MPYTVVRLSSEQVDKILAERQRPDASGDWTYDVVVEVNPDLMETPALADKNMENDAKLSRAVQVVAPA